MDKKTCLRYLNEMLQIIPNTKFFTYLSNELEIEEDELELILSSEILDISNDDIETI